jgi:hypothetical protein
MSNCNCSKCFPLFSCSQSNSMFSVDPYFSPFIAYLDALPQSWAEYQLFTLFCLQLKAQKIFWLNTYKKANFLIRDQINKKERYLKWLQEDKQINLVTKITNCFYKQANEKRPHHYLLPLRMLLKKKKNKFWGFVYINCVVFKFWGFLNMVILSRSTVKNAGI